MDKIKKLECILCEYCKYFGRYTSVKVGVMTESDSIYNTSIEDYNNYIVIKFNNHVINPLKVKVIPYDDIDKETARYRAKLHYKQNNNEMVFDDELTTEQELKIVL
jgi:hypothetical protein